jgi:SAM-dependent methyltransferase
MRPFQSAIEHSPVLVERALTLRSWKLDVGCGRRKQPGHIGVDHSPSADADVIADLNHCIPFQNSVFEKVWMSHLFEHVAEPLPLMEEIWRVSKNGAFVEVRGPHFSSPQLIWGDPTHRRGLSLATFTYFTDTSDWCLTTARFEIQAVRLMKGGTEFLPVKGKVWYWPWLIWNKAWEWCINWSPSMVLRYERVLARFIAFEELRVVLRVGKGGAARG